MSHVIIANPGLVELQKLDNSPGGDGSETSP
jgi:hypothetical protein